MMEATEMFPIIMHEFYCLLDVFMIRVMPKKLLADDVTWAVPPSQLASFPLLSLFTLKPIEFFSTSECCFG